MLVFQVLSQGVTASETIIISSDSEGENENLSNIKSVAERNGRKSKRKPLQDVQAPSVSEQVHLDHAKREGLL